MSKRLEMIVELASAWAPDKKETQGRAFCVADVGTDHGFVPICLVERGIAARALALDVREGPLARAREHVKEHGLERQIDLRLGDGLKPLVPGEADMVILSGMGGELMLRILREKSCVRTSVRRWLFSPQSELALFRHGLAELGLSICYEVMMEEDGKYYTMMVAEPGTMSYPEEYCYRYGQALIQSGSPILQEYLKREACQLMRIQRELKAEGSEGAKRRLKQVKEQLQEVELVRRKLREWVPKEDGVGEMAAAGTEEPVRVHQQKGSPESVL